MKPVKVRRTNKTKTRQKDTKQETGMICSKCRQRNAEETSVIMKKSSYCKLNVIVKKKQLDWPFSQH